MAMADSHSPVLLLALRGRRVGQLFSPAVLDQQVPADQIRQTRTMLEAIVSGHGAAWSKFNPCEEIAELLKGGERHTAARCLTDGQPRRTNRSIPRSSLDLSAGERFLRGCSSSWTLM